MALDAGIAASAGLATSGLMLSLGAFTLGPISLAVAPGRTLVILGPSGSGKTLFLESLAGFRPLQAGRVVLAGCDITDSPPEQRHVGLMFQDYALFPHLSVRENVRFGLRIRRQDGHTRTDTMLRDLGISHLAGRRPGTLSGGERQRVALARSLAVEPRLMLLDEPLSALDAPTRDGVRDLLRTTLSALPIPSIYVTHDQDEAVALADDLAVFRNGRVMQIGPVDEVVDRPADTFVARFMGMELLGEATLRGGRVILAGGRELTATALPAAAVAGAACYRPEDVVLFPADGVSGNVFEAPLVRITPQGALTRLTLGGPLPLTALAFRRSAAGLAPGTTVRALLPATAIRVVPIARD